MKEEKPTNAIIFHILILPIFILALAWVILDTIIHAIKAYARVFKKV